MIVDTPAGISFSLPPLHENFVDHSHKTCLNILWIEVFFLLNGNVFLASICSLGFLVKKFEEGCLYIYITYSSETKESMIDDA